MDVNHPEITTEVPEHLTGIYSTWLEWLREYNAIWTPIARTFRNNRTMWIMTISFRTEEDKIAYIIKFGY